MNLPVNPRTHKFKGHAGSSMSVQSWTSTQQAGSGKFASASQYGEMTHPLVLQQRRIPTDRSSIPASLRMLKRPSPFTEPGDQVERVVTLPVPPEAPERYYDPSRARTHVTHTHLTNTHLTNTHRTPHRATLPQLRGFGGDMQHTLPMMGAMPPPPGVPTHNVYATQQTYTTQQQGGLRQAHGAARTQFVDMRERVTHMAQHTGEERVLAEYFIEHEVKVPKKMVREDVIERTYVIPERVLVEEYVAEDAKYLEKIVEVAHPVIQEKIVEVPEYEYVEKLVEVPQRVIQEKYREVPKVSVQERIIEVPKIVQKDKIVEVPMYEYHDVLVEKNVEVPEIREEVVIKEVPVPQYVEKLVAEERTVEIQEDVPRNTPVPVESYTQLELVLPRVRTIRTALDVPVYIPRFVEVPVAAEFCAEEFVDCAERCGQEVSRLMMRASTEPLSLSELENVAEFVQNQQFEETFARQEFVANFVHWWRSNQLSIDEVSLRSVCRTVEEASGVVVTEAVSLVKPTHKIVSPAVSSQTVTTHMETSSARTANVTRITNMAESHRIPVSLVSDGGLEQAIINDIDTQSIKTDKAEDTLAEEELIQKMPVLAARHSMDSLSSLPLPSRVATYSNPASRSNSTSSIPKQLSTSSPAPIFPIMKGMETGDVSVPLGEVPSRLTGTTFGTLDEEEGVSQEEEGPMSQEEDEIVSQDLPNEEE
eukprot:Gregarina_sp_Pseudo_9__5412@NODE_667_length_2397_cov_29_102205_g630_i0_p1_GENE_NODE_667_length_2397_cov_29_102205_g630_i0NODE_667_length_2397_cov_29_102205_g630_i0_p1_ORF_typecomplete_len705_score172_74IMCp/PF12314_8/1_8e04IMCp/PF12314_8/1_7e02IMCp/PF12314_8/2_8e16IMCp/PF12314_8/0_017IMCp/PF12314_8/8_9e02EZH2_N/PF18601_1/3_4e03EZH2_N/PF18601_1/0_27_NODE_667_length_2397_cov_29_102205_g630_i0672181